MEDQALAEGLRKRIRAFEDVIDADQLPFQPGDDFIANPVLHICLYLNMLFFIFSWITEILLLQPRYDELEQKNKIFTLAVVTYFTVTELIRIYVGHAGNRGRIRLLMLFLILSPVLLFSSGLVVFSRLSSNFAPTECNLFIAYMLLLGIEWVCGMLGLRVMKQLIAESPVEGGEAAKLEGPRQQQ
uniref:transmembrane protein 17B-like n=1 Tax=Pristiophorus japonicus TaxID=55135 RepID=UPI00398F4799